MRGIDFHGRARKIADLAATIVAEESKSMRAPDMSSKLGEGVLL
jgi:hypothetical protein